MKIPRGHIVVVCFCIFAFLFLAWRKAEKCLSIPKKIVCMFDERISCEAKKNIRLFIEHADSSLFYVMSQFDLTIRQQFPYIKSIQTKLVPPATMKVICTSYEPCYAINDTHLIAIANAQAILCPAHVYKKEICNDLPQASVETTAFNTYKAQDIYNILSHVPKNVFASYYVHIAEHDTIILRDKKQHNLTLVVRADSDMALLEKCGTYTRELLESRKAFSCKSAAYYTADLRFDKHIILSKKLKEE
ncbi:MAG TPA: hypothetical protein PKD74_04445 [Candidatus Dependentiae bacterium]|jgi:hypothetical protein|nr:hypothetical protein [Candidatus Dependentiae bacterium]